MDQECSNVGRVDPADSTRLADRTRADSVKFFAGLDPKLGDRRVVDVARECLVFQAAEPIDLEGLAVDVAAIFGGDRHLLDC